MSDVESGAEQVNSVPDSEMQPTGEPQSPREKTGDFSVPSGYRLTPVDEYEKLTRASERARGADQQFGRLKELGYNSLEEALGDLSHVGKVKQRGIGLDRLADAFGEQAPESQEPDIESIIEERLNARFAENDKKQAEASWNKTIDAEVKALNEGVKSLAEEFKVDPDILKDAMENRLHNVAGGNRFGDDHALNGYPNYEGSAEQVVNSFKEAMAKKAGEQAAAIGEAATKRQPKNSTPAGKAGGQGEPESTGESREEQLRAHAKAVVEKRRAARSGAATSQA